MISTKGWPASGDTSKKAIFQRIDAHQLLRYNARGYIIAFLHLVL